VGGEEREQSFQRFVRDGMRGVVMLHDESCMAKNQAGETGIENLWRV
jgi:hypothetical protein